MIEVALSELATEQTCTGRSVTFQECKQDRSQCDLLSCFGVLI